MTDAFLALLACPRCGAAFTAAGDTLGCTGCAATFPIIAGIPRLNDGAVERDARIAAEYEAQAHAHALYIDDRSVMNRLEAQVLPRLIEWLGDADGPILDLGCGVGYFGRAWQRHGRPDVPLIGMDLQVKLIADADVGYAGRLEGDVHRLPMRDGSVGAVVFANALHHVSDPVVALEQVRRVLAPGGVVVAYDPREIGVIEVAKKVLRRKHDAFTEYHRAFKPDEYRSLFERAGLHLERFATVDPIGPLVGTALDMLHAGRLGVAAPAARLLARVDELTTRLDPTGALGLMVLAQARRV